MCARFRRPCHCPCTRAIVSGKYQGHLLGKLYHDWAVEYYDKRDNDRAIADYNEATRIDPAYGDAFYGRGNAWEGECDRAVADYDEAIRLKPKNPCALYNRGSAWQAKGDNDRAIADYNEAIRLAPNYAAALNNRGNAWSNKGDTDRAIAD